MLNISIGVAITVVSTISISYAPGFLEVKTFGKIFLWYFFENGLFVTKKRFLGPPGGTTAVKYHIKLYKFYMYKTCKTCGVSFNSRPVVAVGNRIGGHKRVNCFQCRPYDGLNAAPHPKAYVERKSYPKRNTEKIINVYLCQCCDMKLGRKQSLCKVCRSQFTRYKYRYFCMSYKGWQCECCGKESNRFDDFGEFDFHHVDIKLFEMNQGDSRCLRAIKEELDKCELLCAICHRDKHKKIIPEWFRKNIIGEIYKGEILS